VDQAREVHELRGHLHRTECELQRLEQPVGPAQDGHVAPRDAVRVQRAGAFGDALGLRDLVLVARDLDVPIAVALPGAQELVGVGALVRGQGVDHTVGRLEDPGPRAEVRVQRQLRGLGSVEERELRAEVQEVPQARAAPGVDVLVGVADRRHRMAVAEHPAHQDRLGVVRVLVLVEQHGAEPSR
jgi:hypothetical protein